MEIFPFLIGVFGKIIDEIDDNKLNTNTFLYESLKSLNICFYTLACKNDFLFAFSTFILSIFGAGIDTFFWKTFIIIGLILSIIYLTPVDNWPLFILIISIIIISTHIEEKSFPEEFSIKKLITRIVGLILLSVIYFIPNISKIFNYSITTTNITYISKLILIALGGLFISIISQIYFLWFSNRL